MPAWLQRAFWQLARRVKKESGIGLARQITEAAILRFSRGRLDLWEYLFFDAWSARHPLAEKKSFVGWRGELALDRRLNQNGDRGLANDKLALIGRLAGCHVPAPRTPAVFNYTGTATVPHGTRLLHGPGELREFLGNAPYPLFVKPVRGARGHDVSVLTGFDGDTQTSGLSGGERIGVEALAGRLARIRRGGMLLQELLTPDPALAKVCGNRLTSIRVIVLVPDGAPELLSAVWRVPTGRNITDNYDVGRSGNIIAGVGLDDGRVRRVVRGAGWQHHDIERHPDTGAGFAGLVLPGWPDIRRLCLALAPAFPGLKLQHWDIALTGRGPVVLELNVEGGFRPHQVVAGRGLLDDRLQRMLR